MQKLRVRVKLDMGHITCCGQKHRLTGSLCLPVNAVVPMSDKIVTELITVHLAQRNCTPNGTQARGLHGARQCGPHPSRSPVQNGILIARSYGMCSLEYNDWTSCCIRCEWSILVAAFPENWNTVRNVTEIDSTRLQPPGNLNWIS